MTLPHRVPTRDIARFYPGEVERDRSIPELGLTLRHYRFGEAEGTVHVPANEADHAVSLCVAGQAVVTCETEGRLTRSVVRPGQFSVDPAFTPQAWTWDAPHDVFTAYLSDEALRRVAEEAGLNGDTVRIRHHSAASDAFLRETLTLLRSVRTDEALDLLFAETTLRVIAIHLLRHYARLPLVETETGGLSHVALRRTLDLIEARLAAPPTLSELAHTAALSPYHFARAFKVSAGVTPLRYVAERRVERAKTMLRTGRYRSGEVASALGFADPSHFARVFRRHVGVSPSAFRRQARR